MAEKTLDEILKEMYNSETHIEIKWIWDGGIGVTQIWRSGKEDLEIGCHKDNPSEAIRMAYHHLKKEWNKNKK